VAAVYRFAGGAWSIGLVEHTDPGAGAFHPTMTGLDHVAFALGAERR
jgi:hypothetical protein